MHVFYLLLNSSWDHKDEYERAKVEMDQATENSAHAFIKKRGLAGEIKQYEAQKKEAENFEEKVKDRRECVLQYLLWKLYHIELKSNNLAAEKDQKYFASTEAKNQQVIGKHSCLALVYKQALCLGYLRISI